MQVTIKPYRASFKANPMPKIEAEYLNNKMLAADSVDIFCHKSADEDAFNSQKVLYEYLKKMGKHPRIITTDEKYNYGYDRDRYNIITVPEVTSDTEKADLAVCVDFSKKERLNPNVVEYLEKYDNDSIIGFDHHNENIYISPSTMKITEQYKSVSDIPIEAPKNYYIDSTAKSCTSILYRFLTSIGEPISDDQTKSLYCGMVDDMNKSGLVKFIENLKAKLTPKIDGEDNAKEVYHAIASKVSASDKEDIVAHLDIISTLDDKEKDFQKRLFKEIKFSSNGKLAYVEIPQGDKQWNDLGEDNRRTSIILRDFRTRILDNKISDSNISKTLHEKLKDVQAIAVFYSKPECDSYRMSMHSKNNYAKKYCDYVRDNLYSELIAGGHSNRCGGGTTSADPKVCHSWVEYFIQAGEDVD